MRQAGAGVASARASRSPLDGRTSWKWFARVPSSSPLFSTEKVHLSRDLQSARLALRYLGVSQPQIRSFFGPPERGSNVYLADSGSGLRRDLGGRLSHARRHVTEKRIHHYTRRRKNSLPRSRKDESCIRGSSRPSNSHRRHY